MLNRLAASEYKKQIGIYYEWNKYRKGIVFKYAFRSTHNNLSTSYIKKQNRGSDGISVNGFKVVFIVREIHNMKLVRKKWWLYLKKLGNTIYLPTSICHPLRQAEISYQFDDKFEEISSIAGQNFRILRLRSSSKCG